MTLSAAAKPLFRKIAAALVTGSVIMLSATAGAQAQTPIAHIAAHKPAHKKHRKHKKHGRVARHKRHSHKTTARAGSSVAGPSIQTAGVAAVVAPAVPAVCADAGLEPTSGNIAAVNQAVICLINQQRVAHGDVALAENAKLDAAAAHHSNDMIAANYFEHVSPSGETPEQRVLATGYAPPGAGYQFGENIATGSTGVDTPAQMVAAWMSSPEHRDNILNPAYRETGVSAIAAMPAQYANGASGATYTQEFGVIS